MLAPRTIIISLVLGTVITLLASIMPALRATRVPPIAAVREGSTLPPSRFAAHSLKSAIVVIAGSVAAISVGVFANGLGTMGVVGCCSASGSCRSSSAWPWRPRTWSSR